jgi:hypothetical protein
MVQKTNIYPLSCLADKKRPFFGDFNYLTDHFLIIKDRFYRSERIFLSIFNENRPKGPKTVCRVVNSLKNLKNTDSLKNTEWSSKDRFLDRCSQSFKSRDKRSEYLARFYTFNCIENKKKFIFY